MALPGSGTLCTGIHNELGKVNKAGMVLGARGTQGPGDPPIKPRDLNIFGSRPLPCSNKSSEPNLTPFGPSIGLAYAV